MSSEDRFKAAVNVIRNLPSKGSFQPSTDLQLKFYSYFKQATEGPCTVSKPSFWDVVGKAKWDAWKTLGDMPKEEAMEKYVEELKQIIETMSYTESVSKFMDLLGPFYEVVPLSKSNSQPMLNGEVESNEYAAAEGRVNGFGDQPESDEEFSDTYDHIKESAAVTADGGATKANGGGDTKINGGGDNGYASETSETNNNELEFTSKGPFSNEPFILDSNVVNVKGANNLNSENNSQNILNKIKDKKNKDSDGKPPEKTSNVVNELDHMITQARGGSDQNVIPRSAGGDLGAAGGNPPGGNRSSRARSARDTSLSYGADLSRLLGGASGGSGPPGSGHNSNTDINEQLALAVIKLQHTMDDINARLAALEKALPRSKGTLGVIRKTFGVSPNLLLLILIWPFVATWLIKTAQRRQAN